MADAPSSGSSPSNPPPPGPRSGDETRPLAAQAPGGSDPVRPHGDPLRPHGDPAAPPAPVAPTTTAPPAGAHAASGGAGAAFPPPPAGARPTGPGVSAPPPADPAPTAGGHTDRPGLVGLLVAIGVGLLAAAVTLSLFRSRADGDLDWSNYVVGLGATAVLLAVAVVATVVGRRHDRSDLAAWPGAVGILAAAAMLVLGLDDQDWAEDLLGYLAGGLIVLLSVLGYLAVRRGTFVVTAILGLAILYANGFDDLLGGRVEDDDAAIWVAAAVTVFVVAITLVGWLLPTRALSGVVVGVAAVVTFAGILAVLAIAQLLPFFFSGMGLGPTGEDPFAAPSRPDFDTDVWVVWALAALLVLLWAAAAARTGNAGFTLAAVAMPAVTVPLGTVVLAVEHPTWWGVTLAAAGSILLALAVLGLLRSRRTTA